MPSRLITGAILAFWLAMTGWIIEREVVPLMLADAAPTFVPDLTDEIGSPVAGWTVLRDGKRIGSGTSRVLPRENRTFAFESTFHFDTFLLWRLQIRRLENSYRVTEDGKLLGLSARVLGNLEGQKEDLTVSVEGEVVGHAFEPRLSFLGITQKLDKVELRQGGGIVNPMHLVNRLRGLRPGQTWKIPMVDPFQGLASKMIGEFTKGMSIPWVIAEVTTGTLTWNREEVECYVIEYHEPGKEVTASTWVRKIDGLVLQQEAHHGVFSLTLQRIAT